MSRGAKSVQLVLMRPDGYKISSERSNDGAYQSRPSEAKTEAETRDDVTASQCRNDTPLQTPAPHKTPSDRAILTLLLVSGQITQAEYMAYESIRRRTEAGTGTPSQLSQIPPSAFRVSHQIQYGEVSTSLSCSSNKLPFGQILEHT